jgi:hypothetical protein
MTRDRIIYDFEDVLQKSYNIDHEEPGWYRFSKGKFNFQGGIKGERFQISLELFVLDDTAVAHLDKDMKKATKALESCLIEREGNAVWLSTTISFAEVNPNAIREMLENCLSAAKTRPIWNLSTQHKQAPKRF